MAIQSLHAAKYAHLDIRLPNICFKPDGTVVLIDLDNYMDSSLLANSILRSNSVMYNYQGRKLLPGVAPTEFPVHWTVQNIDFRQLGIMMQYIENPDLCDDYHWMDLSSISNQYINFT